MNLLKIISFASLLIGWLEESSKDGEISADEVADLVIQAVSISGLDLKIKL